MEINSSSIVLSSIILVIAVFIQVKIWRFIANAIGEKLGIGKYIIGTIEKLTKDR